MSETRACEHGKPRPHWYNPSDYGQPSGETAHCPGPVGWQCEVCGFATLNGDLITWPIADRHVDLVCV